MHIHRRRKSNTHTWQTKQIDTEKKIPRNSRWRESNSFRYHSSYCSTQWAYWVCQAHCMFLPVFIVNVMLFRLFFFFFYFFLVFSFVLLSILYCCDIVLFFSLLVKCVCVWERVSIYLVLFSWLLSIPILYDSFFVSLNSYMNGFSFAFHFAPMLIILTCKHALHYLALYMFIVLFLIYIFFYFVQPFSFVWKFFRIFDSCSLYFIWHFFFFFRTNSEAKKKTILFYVVSLAFRFKKMLWHFDCKDFFFHKMAYFMYFSFYLHSCDFNWV